MFLNLNVGKRLKGVKDKVKSEKLFKLK